MNKNQLNSRKSIIQKIYKYYGDVYCLPGLHNHSIEYVNWARSVQAGGPKPHCKHEWPLPGYDELKWISQGREHTWKYPPCMLCLIEQEIEEINKIQTTNSSFS
ncbi:hypothetical protein LCGC14_2461630 [marine sediment metagenome]|uniref:Uncharacterized protein n=2 Tax=root TaxID=1 RepID=A0A0F9DQ82_9ZZZZ|nr:MAG: hypothetical protein LCMAC202_03950 [Marseillevirus LCMAC202]